MEIIISKVKSKPVKKALYILFFAFVSFSLSLNAQSWEQHADIPGGTRHHPICFSIDDIGYVLCGNPNPAETSDPALKDFYSYDPATDVWTKKADFPGSPRGFGVGLNYNEKGYVGFGYGDNMYLNDLWEYDAEKDEWTQLPSCPCLGRTHPAFLAAQGKIYVGLGGVGTNARDWWSYDLDDRRWTQEQAYPGIARHHPYYFTVDDIPYVGFGHSANAIHNDFGMFDPANREWVLMNQFPSHERVAGTHFAFNGKGYILAGDNELHRYDEAELWEYTPTNDSWVQLPTFPEDGRWAPGAFVIGNRGYLIAGYARNTRVYHNDLWSYQLSPTTSTDDEVKIDLTISPNPAVDVVTLQGEWPSQTSFEVFDQGGRQVAVLAPGQKELLVSGWTTGVYFIRSPDAPSVNVGSFVKK